MNELNHEEILENEARRLELQRIASKKHYDAHKEDVLKKQRKYRAEKIKKVEQAKKYVIEKLPPAPQPAPTPEPAPAPIEQPEQFTFTKNKKTNKISYVLNLETLKNLINGLNIADLTKKKNIDDSKILFRLTNTDKLNNILKNPKKLIKIVENSKSQTDEDYSNNTKKGLAHLILIICDNGWIGETEKEKLHNDYKDLYKRFDFITKEQTKLNKNIEYHDIDDYVQRVLDKFGVDSKQYLVTKLYRESTRRDDFQLVIINNISQANDNSKNYILVPPTRTVCETIINSHKTGHVYEPLTKKLSQNLSNLIRAYIINHSLKQGDYLLGKSNLTQYVSNISKEIGLKGITINTLRKMTVSKFLSVPRTIEERQQLANEFGHSLGIQEGVYRGILAK